MGRPRKSIPTFCISASGRAFCKVAGEFVSLGQGDNPETRLKYANVLQRLAQGLPIGDEKPTAPPVDRPGGPSVNELCLAFLVHAGTEYIDPLTGKPSAEVACYLVAVKHLREMFGETLAKDFGPVKLRAVRERYVDKGWSRGFCNKQVARLRHIWRWAIAREQVPAAVLVGLKALEPLKAGKTTARETDKRRAVPVADIEAVKAVVRRRTKDIIDLLLYTGARPAEVLGLTTAMIQSRETIDGVWVITLTKHKNAHRGQERRLYFNVLAQQILLRYLNTAEPDKRLFPVKRHSFGHTVKAACIRAGVKPFTPHWLRHTTISRVRDEAGAEAAQRVAGHATISMTDTYSRAAERAAVDAVKRIG